jgi:vacuolar-type H+-ATPase subunit I/STV1
MAQDNGKKAKVDAILAGVPARSAPTKTENVASIARQISSVDRQIERLQARRDKLADELIAANET